jgi:hypothetical protein
VNLQDLAIGALRNVPNWHYFRSGRKRRYNTANEAKDLHCASSFPGTPIGPLPTITAGFEIVPELLLAMIAAPEIRGVNKR